MGLMATSFGYVKIYKNRIVFQFPSENKTVEKVGEFSHPRMLIGKFQEAENLLKHALKSTYPSKFIKPSLVLIIHPKEILEGGISEIEERVLMELGLGAGARQVKIWQGHDLSTDEIRGFKL
jgi:rod shape-determining protein MreB